MALSGLDIYKLLPKTNCKECGFATCLAFAMQLAKKTVNLEKCPHVSADAKKALEASSQPPIKLITIGKQDNRLEIGNETVLFRHEEKFHHPAGIGIIIEDDLSDEEITKGLEKINELSFERVGQQISVNLIALKQKTDASRFAAVTSIITKKSSLALVLMAGDEAALRGALELTKDLRPLVYPLSSDRLDGFAKLAGEFKVPLVVPSCDDLEKLCSLTKNLNSKGVNDLVIEVQESSLSRAIWQLTQIRRLALKKQERALGYPSLISVKEKDPYLAVQHAATYITKYAGIVLINSRKPSEVLSILTLRQNIYTDPQKPLQIEPKLYPIGAVSKDSPLLITTNFSLTYYTVLGEVEASKVAAYILSVDTEGMSVLTAWAAEKFTPESIVKGMDKFGAKEAISNQRMIIPGYVAVMSGDLEEQSGWKIIVGPKEASGIPSFLKNL